MTKRPPNTAKPDIKRGPSLQPGKPFEKTSDSALWKRAELRAIYKHAPVMLCTLDVNRSVIFANRAFCSFTGVSERRLIGGRACGVFGCINALEDPRGCGFGQKCAECKLLTAIDDTIKTGRKHKNVEYRAALNRHGSKQQVVLMGSTVRISVGGEFRLLLCLQDITESNRIKQGLRESEARQRAIFEHCMAGILFTAPDGRVFAANSAACKMLGITEKDICRLGRSGLVDHRDPRVGSLLRERSQKGFGMGEMNFIRSDGKQFPVQIASAVFETAEGLRTSMAFLDLSERKLGEERIRRFSQKLLSVREEEKRNLSTVLHHEIGAIVVGVTARLNATEQDLQKGRKKEALASLRKCRKVFMKATKRLKKLAVELRPPDLDLLGLGDSLRQYLAQIARETSLKIHFADTLHSREISPEKQTFLFRTAQECLNNIIQHANANKVRVRLSYVRQQIQLSMADDGRGFNSNDLANISNSHLGLRSIQEMTTALEGRLSITSSQKDGTNVTVTIPGGGNEMRTKNKNRGRRHLC